MFSYTLSIHIVTSQAVRLQGPLSRHGFGLVEVFYGGQWGKICDNNWDIDNARVVCRQLGYEYGVRAYKGGQSYLGNRKIWLDEVNCTGSEPNLTSCSHSGWGNRKCKDFKDVGVECSSTGEATKYNLHFLLTYMEI